MAKRKCGLNDIIFELDNDDIVISSDDEVKQPKINCLKENNSPITTHSDSNTQSSSEDVILIDSSIERVDILASKNNQSTDQNGGKICDDTLSDQPSSAKTTCETIENSGTPNTDADDDRSKTIIFDEDILLDSPGSNTDQGVVGCENRTPLVTVRFKDSKLAMNYKKKIKAFMLDLIRLHDEKADSGSETDLELDIWPEDFVDEEIEVVQDEPEETLFFVDTDPCSNLSEGVPRYSQNSTIISNEREKEPSPPPVFRKGPICFNCNGEHPLRECNKPRNNARIAGNRKAAARMGRYHVEDEQKYGHLVPGRISNQLRHALGLNRNQLPLHIYQMRVLGYPPGWLEEARISHSGITLFDSTGQAILDPEEEEGEVNEPGSKDKFDIKKILDFPGFNIPASSRYVEEAHLLGLPPMSAQDSKLAMLQTLAPNAMRAYKRKKLTFFPSVAGNDSPAGLVEMDLDSDEEVAFFPSQPPLPDDAPPPPPPPPEAPPPPKVLPPPPDTPPPLPPNDSPIPLPSSPPPLPAPQAPETTNKLIKLNDTDSDVEFVESMSDLITIDVEGNVSDSGLKSPSLDFLEQQKKILLDALESEQEPNIDVAMEVSKDVTSTGEVINSLTDDKADKDDQQNDDSIELNSDMIIVDTTSGPNEETQIETLSVNEVLNEASTNNDSKSPETPNTSTVGCVKGTHYGTPVINVASPYVNLPSDDKFAKDICDVIFFENLPNTIGKYKQISTLLKKVKTEVDRIQES